MILLKEPVAELRVCWRGFRGGSGGLRKLIRRCYDGDKGFKMLVDVDRRGIVWWRRMQKTGRVDCAVFCAYWSRCGQCTAHPEALRAF